MCTFMQINTVFSFVFEHIELTKFRASLKFQGNFYEGDTILKSTLIFNAFCLKAELIY